MPRILAALALSLAATVHAAGETNADASGLALQGYDPVAYFTEQRKADEQWPALRSK